MNPKIKTICLILITLIILAGAGFYWYQRQEITKTCILRCDYTAGRFWQYRGYDKYFSTRDECVDWCLASGVSISMSEWLQMFGE